MVLIKVTERSHRLNNQLTKFVEENCIARTVTFIKLQTWITHIAYD